MIEIQGLFVKQIHIEVKESHFENFGGAGITIYGSSKIYNGKIYIIDNILRQLKVEAIIISNICNIV